MDFDRFHKGKEFEAYKFLGAHVCDRGTVFRTYAPNADHICVIGEFSNWQEVPMKKTQDGNFWECWLEQAQAGMMYKYRVYPKLGKPVEHSDPYAFYCEVRPNTASVIFDSSYSFNDLDWMKRRTVCMDQPMNIYEIHLSS